MNWNTSSRKNNKDKVLLGFAHIPPLCQRRFFLSQIFEKMSFQVNSAFWPWTGTRLRAIFQGQDRMTDVLRPIPCSLIESLGEATGHSREQAYLFDVLRHALGH